MKNKSNSRSRSEIKITIMLDLKFILGRPVLKNIQSVNNEIMIIRVQMLI